MSAPTSDRDATGVFSPTRAQIAQRTLRTDNWLKSPIVTDLGFAAFIIYATVRAFQRDHFFVEKYHYLTPFYSPCLSKACGDASDFWPQILPTTGLFSLIPFAFLSLPFLLLFRLTCYYYRKAYYRSFWFSPPACAVAEPHRRYHGESRGLGLGQNLHRYFFYAAVLISLINTYDAFRAFVTADGRFGLGLGNLILLANVVLLWAYTVSCHSCRSIIGGRLTHFSRHPMRYRAWQFISRLNAKHMQLAWITLGTLALTDFYIMAVSAGWFDDPRFIN